MSINPFSSSGYSTQSREYYGVVPANALGSGFECPQGQFSISTLMQSDILTVLLERPGVIGHGLYDVSLADAIEPTWKSVGMMKLGENQVGSCTLISVDLAIIPSHCIEGLDVRELQAVFEYAREPGASGRIQPGASYRVLYVEESDPSLDYAVVKLEGTPGSVHAWMPISKSFSETPSALLHHPFNIRHHPIGKPLQVSVHRTLQMSHARYGNLVQTFHDSDHGSSGGAYISPSGKLNAMHLGSERDPTDLNLLRFSLPIQKIIEKDPEGILSRLADGRLDQGTVYSTLGTKPSIFLDICLRDFIDFENFLHANVLADGSYLLRPSGKKPKVIIDHGQAKHTLGWPGGWAGKRGSVFNFPALDDTISLANLIIEDIPLFANVYEKNYVPEQIQWPIDKRKLSRELLKKLGKATQIHIQAGFNAETKSWDIHFFPDKS